MNPATIQIGTKKIPRWAIVTTLAIVGLILLIILTAPNSSWKQSGSTYRRSPDGYGAWYAYMTEQQATPITRWRRPFNELMTTKPQQAKTLLRVHPRLTDRPLSDLDRRWLEAGNDLIILGVREPATTAPFTNRLDSAMGKVKIETTRRAKLQATASSTSNILADAAGLVVWQASAVKDKRSGQLIYATTPHLAANAYQDEAGNFALLAQLIKQSNQAIFVDEYLHGYTDVNPAKKELKKKPLADTDYDRGDVISYLAQTPVLPVVVQAAILTLIAVWAKNRRFGRLQSVTPPTIDNSTAYIQALSGALQQAQSRSFVIETINKAEFRTLQRQLGLGDTPVDPQTLIATWAEQTKQSPESLQQLIQLQNTKNLDDRTLLQWLDILQKVRT
jgi:hypothetical protein